MEGRTLKRQAMFRVFRVCNDFGPTLPSTNMEHHSGLQEDHVSSRGTRGGFHGSGQEGT